MPIVHDRSITLRRDHKGPLKFNGDRIGDATRQYSATDEQTGNDEVISKSARLFRTTSGKYVLGVEQYNKTQECYLDRDAWKSDSLEGLLAEIKGCRPHYLDDDLLAELFEDTAIASQFVEQVE